MKKILGIALLFMLAVTMVSCSSSPSSLAADFLEKVKQQDDSNLQDEDEWFAYHLAVETFDHHTRGGIESYEILGEEIEDGGREAFVNVKIICNSGKKETKNIRYVKKDGSWAIDGETFRYW